ncbi:MAG: hypothetical protein JNN20_10235 [Betaproteobacteria bacterium]|nr:hypothetical protein [Betaproteobacteria bacterium]
MHSIRYRFLATAITLALLLSATTGHADNATHTFDANGRLYQVIGPNWTTTYTYDGAGNVTNVVKTTTVFSLLSVASRKVHGTAGNFEIPLDTSVAIGGAVSIEPRAIGAGHTIVFKFNSPITNPGTAIAYDKLGAQIGSATTAASGNEVRVTLTGSTLNTKRVRVEVSGVNGGGTVYSVAMGFLLADVNSGGSVNSIDKIAVSARSGQSVSMNNAPFDVNASGGINGSDILTVNGQMSMVLESP